MQIDDGGKQAKLWLTRGEYQDLRRKMLQMYGTEGELIAEYGGTLMMRSQSYPRVCYGDVHRTDTGKHKIKVKEKNPEGNGLKTRFMFLDEKVEEKLFKHYTDNDLAQSEPLVDKSNRTCRRWIKNAGEELAREEGRPDEWQHLSSHDLRRHAAHYYLVEQRLNPRAVMRCGGWESFSAIKPYLNQPSESVIEEEFSGVYE